MKKIYTYLSYVGALPFVFCAICFIEDIHILPLFGHTDMVLSAYSLVISSFMAGSHWGQHLNLSNKWAIYLPFISIISAIFLWISFIVFSFEVLLFVFAVSFLILLLIDKALFQDGLISREYFRTRCFLTMIVISSLIVSGFYAWWILPSLEGGLTRLTAANILNSYVKYHTIGKSGREGDRVSTKSSASYFLTWCSSQNQDGYV